MFKIKIDKADTEFSKYIRARDHYICQRCFKMDGKMECSHYFSRGNESVRFDPINCDCLCFGCHAYFHREAEEHRNWKIKRIGQREFDLLLLRKGTYKKKRSCNGIYNCESVIEKRFQDIKIFRKISKKVVDNTLNIVYYVNIIYYFSHMDVSDLQNVIDRLQSELSDAQNKIDSLESKLNDECDRADDAESELADIKDSMDSIYRISKQY